MMKTKFNLIFILLLFSLNSVLAQSEKALKVFDRIAKAESSPHFLQLKDSEKMEKDAFLQTAKTLLDLSDKDDFQNLKVQTDELGWKHYKLQQTHQNIPIEFSQYLLHEKDGKIQVANGQTTPFLDLDPTPNFSDAAALQILLNEVNAEKYAWEENEMETMLKEVEQNAEATYCPKSELVWIDPTFENETENYKLAYKFDVFSIEPYERYYYYVDAKTGEILTKISRIHENDANGTASTNYYGTVNIKTDAHNGSYRLRETGRGNGICTFTCNNTTSFPMIDITDSNNSWFSSSTRNGCEAHWATEQTYDYFLSEHNRDSYDGQGAKLRSWVNYGNNVVNAFWTGSFMVYGDGNGTNYGALTCLDVVGHEVTHAITQHTAGLIYQNESGALNESFSDIFGTVIEFNKETNNADKDWYMGEDANNTGNGFRNMSNPKSESHPDTYQGEHWFTGSGDNGGVHYNSGVQNYWFYLLSQGGNGTNDNNDAYNVNGIGMSKAAKIAFRNLTVYLTPNSNYAAARNGSIQAATDLYGTNSNEVQQVKNAWCAVGVGTCTNAPSGQITVTSPNGGENLTAGQVHPITWTSSNVGSHVKIDYSVNGGTSWSGITSSTPNDGVRNWTVPSVSSNLVRIRITSKSDNSIYDISNANFSISPAAPTNCDAASIELGSDVNLPSSGSVTLSTNVSDMAYTLWDYNGSLIGTTESITVSNTGLYVASVVDSCGNTGSDTIQVLPANGSTSNVWPGDMNFDGVVNHTDLPPMGFIFGQTGPSRINQDINWYGHPSSDWSQNQANGKNLKHLDTDGNGVIDVNDPQAILTNYNKTHTEASSTLNLSEDGLSPFQMSLQTTAIPSFENNDNLLHLDIILNDTSGTNIAFYGGYFSIDYDNSLGLLSNPQVNLEDSWLGTIGEDVLYIAHHDSSNQSIDIGITRLDLANSIGYGKIGTLTFEINESSIGFSENIVLDFDISGVSVHNNEAFNLPISSPYSSIAFSANECPYDLVITPNTFLQNIHQAANNISTNGNIHIDNEQDVTFKSNEADINEGFAIEIGTSFGVEIAPCSPNGFKPNNDDNYTKLTHQLAFNYVVEKASQLTFEILDSNGNQVYKKKYGYQDLGKKTFKIEESLLPKGRLLGVFIQHHKRHYFSFEHF